MSRRVEAVACIAFCVACGSSPGAEPEKDAGSSTTPDAQVPNPDAGPTCTTQAPPTSGYFVSPSGSASGDGTAGKPWDLATALASTTVPPGSTIWLRGGTYTGVFVSTLKGASGNPITVRGSPGEHAVLDSVNKGQSLTIKGAWTTFQDFEITNSDPQRWFDAYVGGANRFDCIENDGPNTKIVHLVLHDCGMGIGLWSAATDAEVYGSVIFYNGLDAPDRGHGHAIYVQSTPTSTKLLEDNILFRQFSYGVHGYTENGNIDNIQAVGNIAFNTGELSKVSGFKTNILIGGLHVANAPRVISNATYSPAGKGVADNIGYSAGSSGAIVQGNYFVGGTALKLVAATDVQSIENNTFVGTLSGFSASTYPNNTFATAPAGTQTLVRPSKYEPGRAHVAIYNWDGQGTVMVDVSKALTPGTAYEIVDAQDPLGAPIATGTYTGASIPFPMTSTKVAVPIGNVGNQPVHTSIEFGAFILRAACP